MKLWFALTCLLAPSLGAQSLQHHTGTILTPQVVLGYETFGLPTAALPVIAVNGGPGLSHIYMVQNDMWNKIARHRLVVFYDQRGTGASKKVQPNAPMTMDAQVADLEALRATLKLQKFALVGDSYGGFLAMAYAAAHPDHVARLVLSDAAGPSYKGMVRILPDVFPDIEEQSAAEQKKLASDPEAAAQAGLRAHFRMIFYSLEKEQAYMAHAGDLGFVPAVANAVSTAAANLDLTDKLPTFHFPTLVITGRWDMNVAPLSAWRIAKSIPGARFEVFEKSGHLPSYEEPEKYQQVLEQFLNAN